MQESSDMKKLKMRGEFWLIGNVGKEKLLLWDSNVNEEEMIMRIEEIIRVKLERRLIVQICWYEIQI